MTLYGLLFYSHTWVSWNCRERHFLVGLWQIWQSRSPLISLSGLPRKKGVPLHSREEFWSARYHFNEPWYVHQVLRNKFSLEPLLNVTLGCQHGFSCFFDIFVNVLGIFLSEALTLERSLIIIIFFGKHQVETGVDVIQNTLLDTQAFCA